MSLYEKMMESLPELNQLFTKNIAEPGKRLKKVRDNLDDLDMIHQFDAESNGRPGWLAAIDGGTAIEKLSTGDLLMSGSTVDGGTHRQPSFPDTEEFDDLWFTIKPHMSSNDRLLSAARAVQELRIFAQTHPSKVGSEGVRLIDGAWLGNLSTVLYSLIEPSLADEIVSMNDYDRDGFLAEGLSSTLSIENSGRSALALAKSDSDRVYVSRWSNPREGEFILEDREEAKYYTDRFITSYVLEPGEFVTPRTVMSNRHLINKLTEVDNKLEQTLSRARDKVRFADALREYKRLLQDIEDSGSLWCVYFKPSEFNKFGKTLKLEFLYKPDPSSTPEEQRSSLLETAKTAIETVNSDIHTSDILEPMCQFNVDRKAKDVSGAMRLALNHLSMNSDEEDFYRNLASGYRS